MGEFLRTQLAEGLGIVVGRVGLSVKCRHEGDLGCLLGRLHVLNQLLQQVVGGQGDVDRLAFGDAHLDAAISVVGGRCGRGRCNGSGSGSGSTRGAVGSLGLALELVLLQLCPVVPS